VFLVAGCTAGCAEATSSPVVVKIDGGRSITKAALDRWTTIEAIIVHEPNPRQRAPKGVIPDPPSYASCVAYLRKSAPKPVAGARAPSTSQLVSECHKQHTALQGQILEILITSDWLTKEGARLGVKVSYAEAKHVLDAKFTKPALRKFLMLTGEREADEEFLLKRTMLSNKLLTALEKPNLPGAQRQQAVTAFYQGVTSRWTARTDCRRGYVVPECRQYQAPKA
jgi:hypothetical protein